MDEFIKDHYRRHTDLFIEDWLGVRLKFHQRLILRLMRLLPEKKNYVDLGNDVRIVFGRRGMPYFIYKEDGMWKLAEEVK